MIAGANIQVNAVVENGKALRAVRFINETMRDLEEDFGYREDVKRAAKAARYLVKQLRLCRCKGE